MNKILYVVNINTRELKAFDSQVGVRLFLKENNGWRFIRID